MNTTNNIKSCLDFFKQESLACPNKEIVGLLGIPPRFIGTGEEPNAFAIFQKQPFVQEIL